MWLVVGVSVVVMGGICVVAVAVGGGGGVLMSVNMHTLVLVMRASSVHAPPPSTSLPSLPPPHGLTAVMLISFSALTCIQRSIQITTTNQHPRVVAAAPTDAEAARMLGAVDARLVGEDG